MGNIDSFPESFTGPAAWTASELRNSPELWLYNLGDAEVAELKHAAYAYLESGADIGEITRQEFPLPILSTYLEALQSELLRGHGVKVIRGLPLADESLELAACIFCGIGAHLGRARSQNAMGHILETFHTDSADVVGLLCWRAAKSGGESLLVSALSLYNEFKKQRPDLLPLLFEPIATDRRGEVPEGADPFVLIPIFSWYQEHLTVFYQRQYIESAQRFPTAPRLTDRHREALDLFDALANDPTLHFSMQLEPGDMQFVYNHSQLHDRTGFEDFEDLDQRRHMLRLWLSMDGDRTLPEVFKSRYGSIEVGNRGGIVTANTKLHAPLE